MKLKICQSRNLLLSLLVTIITIESSEIAEKFDSLKLHRAAMDNDVRKITRLLDSRVDINALESRGRTALDIALLNNCFSAAETLIKSRADMSIAADKHGNSLLHVASVNCNAAIVSLLLKHAPKCLVDKPDIGGNTPLMMALGHGNRYLVEGLLKKKADVAKCNLEGDGPLHSAVICHTNTDALQVYLDKSGISSFDLSRRNKNGLTALDRAILKHNFPVAKLYLDKGAAVNFLPDKTNSLHLAAASNFSDIERMFSPVLINSQDEDGFTPLHIAAQSGQAEVVAKLLDAGADSQIMNMQEETPLMSITHTDCLPTTRIVAEMLLEANSGSCLVIDGQPDILETATFIVACQKGKLPLLQAFAAKRSLSPKILKNGASLAIDHNHTDCAEFLTQQLHLGEEKFDQMPALVAIGGCIQDNGMQICKAVSSGQRNSPAASVDQ